MRNYREIENGWVHGTVLLAAVSKIFKCKGLGPGPAKFVVCLMGL